MREREKTKDFSKLCQLIMSLSVIFITVFLSSLIMYQLISIHWLSCTAFTRILLPVPGPWEKFSWEIWRMEARPVTVPSSPESFFSLSVSWARCVCLVLWRRTWCLQNVCSNQDQSQCELIEVSACASGFWLMHLSSRLWLLSPTLHPFVLPYCLSDLNLLGQLGKAKISETKVCVCTHTYIYVCVLHCFSCVWLFATLDCSHQAPLSMGFSRQENWSGLP